MKKWLLILVAIFSMGILVKVFSLGRSSIHQSISFNHKKHVGVGLDCIDCHVNVEDGMQATIPTLSDCMGCHEDAQTESREEETLRTMAADGVVYPWKQIAVMDEDILFSHQRHVVFGEVECNKCHGNMEEREEPPRKVPIKLSMKFCMDCHEEQSADNDCIACHR